MSNPPPPFLISSDNPNYNSPPQITSPSQSSSSSSLANLSPGIVITLLILSITIIATACIFLFFRHLHRLPVPCLIRAATSTSTSSAPPSAAQSLRRTHGHGNGNGPAQTTTSSVLDSLPLFSFSSVVRRSSTTAADSDCAVCLSKFSPHEQLRLLPLCCHAFHAECIDTWLRSNHTCPLCRSNIHASDSEIGALLRPESAGSGSFRVEIGSVSRRGAVSDSGEARVSYSIGSFDYIVDDESEVAVHRRSVSDKEETASQVMMAVDPALAAEVASGRSWLGDYMDRLSSRALSFRSSRRFFTGSSRRSEAAAGVGEWDLEASRVGEEISELFRWASGV